MNADNIFANHLKTLHKGVGNLWYHFDESEKPYDSGSYLGVYYYPDVEGANLRSDGYAGTEYRYEVKHQNFVLHQMEFVVNAEDKGFEHTASHLCGHPRCFFPLHVLDEPLTVNQSRNRCSQEWRCYHDGGAKGLLEICPHEPKCLDCG